jgi:hypothetical protein
MGVSHLKITIFGETAYREMQMGVDMERHNGFFFVRMCKTKKPFPSYVVFHMVSTFRQWKQDRPWAYEHNTEARSAQPVLQWKRNKYYIFRVCL